MSKKNRQHRWAAAPQAAQPTQTVSDAQLAANRANAQLSTGPRSQTGLTASALNAVKTGLTGRTVLLPPTTTPPTSSTCLTTKQSWRRWLA